MPLSEYAVRRARAPGSRRSAVLGDRADRGLFVNRKRKPMGPRDVRAMVDGYAGAPFAGASGRRRTRCGTRSRRTCWKEGADIRAVQELLGHAASPRRSATPMSRGRGCSKPMSDPTRGPDRRAPRRRRPRPRRRASPRAKTANRDQDRRRQGPTTTDGEGRRHVGARWTRAPSRTRCPPQVDDVARQELARVQEPTPTCRRARAADPALRAAGEVRGVAAWRPACPPASTRRTSCPTGCSG